MKNVRTKFGVAIAAGLFLSACGSDDESLEDASGDSQTIVEETTTVSQSETDVSKSSVSDSEPVATTEETADGQEPEVSSTTVEAASSAVISGSFSSLGEILVDSEGMTVYGFVPDIAAGKVTCLDACLEAWPPVTVPSSELPAGLDANIFSVVEGPNGSQLQAGEMPLYLFANDAKSGDTAGQGVGDNWYVVGANGKLIK